MTRVKKKIVISCGCCVVKYFNNVPHILLVQPSKYKITYGVAKGHLEPGETYRDCAVRETWEETGVMPKIISSLPTVKTSYRDEIKYVKSYLAIPMELDFIIQGDGENFDIRFFPIENLPDIHPYQRPIINAAIDAILSGVIPNV